MNTSNPVLCFVMILMMIRNVTAMISSMMIMIISMMIMIMEDIK